MSRTWQVFLKHTDGKTHPINFTKSKEEVTVVEFKALVQKKLGIPPDQQRLIYGGRQLDDDKTLADYPTLERGSLVFLVLRLPGGGTPTELVDIEHPIPAGIGRTDEKCIICQDSPAMLMPCQHAMHPECLMEYTWSEISHYVKSQIRCPICSTEWSMSILKRYGCTNTGELRLLEDGLSKNAIISDQNTSECPGCGSFCERMDNKKARVFCNICQEQGKNSWYCWHCKKPWANSASDNECGNPICTAAGIIAQIQGAPLIEVVGVECPSIRLCPQCGVAIEHTKGCKHMTCSKCGTKFCFICLRMRRNGSWQCGGYDDKCTPAPVQTSAPKNLSCENNGSCSIL